MIWGCIIALAIGAIAGWLAGNIMRGGGFGLIGNIVIGMVGSIVGAWLLSLLGLSLGGGYIGAIIGAVIGAVVILFIVGLFKK